MRNLIKRTEFTELTKEEIRIVILVWVSENVQIKLKDYNIENAPTARSTKIWSVGRGKNPFSNTYVSNKIKEDIKLEIGGAEKETEIKKIINEISENIIEHSMEIVEELIQAAKNAKTEKVRKKYTLAVYNQDYLKLAFLLSTLFYCEELIKMGYDINHKTLTLKLENLEVNKKRLNKIWKEYAESEKTVEEYQETIEKMNEIFWEYQTKVLVDKNDFRQMVREVSLYESVGEENLDLLLRDIMQELEERITGQLRLYHIKDYTEFNKI